MVPLISVSPAIPVILPLGLLARIPALASSVIFLSAIRILAIVVPRMRRILGPRTYIIEMPIIFTVFAPGVSVEKCIVIVMVVPMPALEKIFILVPLSVRLNIIFPNLLLFVIPRDIWSRITVIET